MEINEIILTFLSSDGVLKDIKTGKGFEFTKYKDPKLNQKRYEELGEVRTN